MQAIHTKYIPASDTRAAKIKAYNESNPKGVTVSINYDLDDVGRHAVAAKAFIMKYWTYHNKDSVLTYGGSADGKGYVFCCIDSTIDLKTLEV
jgi:hypothetical protein